MYDINSKQYIIKQTSGKTINIYNKINSGAYFRFMNKKDIWSEPSLITKDIMPGFSVFTDASDKIHILCQDRQGHIKYMSYENEKWSSKIILKSKSFSPYDKHLCVVSNEKNIHFLYTLRYSEKNLLSYQILKSNGELSDPKVIDYVSECPNPYIVQHDLNGNLYLFYTYQDNRLSRVGYKKYAVSRNTWSDFFPITEFNGESNIIASALVSKETLYTCWQRHTSSNYELVLSVKSSDSEEWDKEKLVSKSTIPFTNSSMVVVNDKILVYWLKDNNIMYSFSNDNGDTWSSPKAYAFPNTDQVHCVAYISNVENDSFNQQYSILPGTFTNGYRLAFSEEKAIELNVPTTINTVPDDFQIPVLDSLKILSQDIEIMKKVLTGIEEKLDAIENKQKQLEVELGRYNSKLVITDTDLSKIISLLKDMNQASVNNQTKPEKHLTQQPESRIEDSINLNQTNQTPVMPGTGFASITPEFLWNLQKK